MLAIRNRLKTLEVESKKNEKGETPFNKNIIDKKPKKKRISLKSQASFGASLMDRVLINYLFIATF